MIIKKIEKSIGAKITAIIAGVSIIVFLIIIAITNNIVTNKFFNMVDDTIVRRIEQNSDFIGSWVEKRKNQLEDYAAALEKGRLDIQQRERFLKDRHNKFSDIYKSFLFIDKEGNFVETNNAAGNISNKDYFHQVMKGKTIISDLVLSQSTGDAISIVATPIKNNKQVVGALAGSIDLKSFTKLVAEMKIDHPNSFSYIINSKGDLITYPGLALILRQNIKDLEELKGISTNLLNNSSGRVEYTFEGEKSYAYFHEIKGTAGWKLVTKVPDAFISKPISNVRDSLLLMLGIALLILLTCGALVANYISKYLNIFSEYSQRIAQKDLSTLLDSKLLNRSDEFGILARTFNLMLENLNQITKLMKNNIEDVSAYSQQLSAAAEEGSTTIDDTKVLIESTLLTVDEISVASKQVEEYSKEATEQANLGEVNIKQTINSIEEVDQSVEETVEIINQLDYVSKEIDQIIAVITNIADETNILSLNATIEAARANKYGRGFAVVAEEIRLLSKETAEAADRISKLIMKTQSQCNKGLKAINKVNQKTKHSQEIVEKTGRNFKDIQRFIEDTSVQVQETINSINNLAVNSNEINYATDDIANMSDEVANSAQELAIMSQELQKIIEEFKV